MIRHATIIPDNSQIRRGVDTSTGSKKKGIYIYTQIITKNMRRKINGKIKKK